MLNGEYYMLIGEYYINKLMNIIFITTKKLKYFKTLYDVLLRNYASGLKII